MPPHIILLTSTVPIIHMGRDTSIVIHIQSYLVNNLLLQASICSNSVTNRVGTDLLTVTCFQKARPCLALDCSPTMGMHLLHPMYHHVIAKKPRDNESHSLLEPV